MKKIIYIIMLLAVTSCKTHERVITVEKVRTDTTYITKAQRDSIWLHDSIHVRERGDTVLLERWHTKYVERKMHDTIYKTTHDSVPVLYPVEVKVEKQLTTWQQTKMNMGVVFILMLILVFLFFIYKILKK